MKMLCQSCKTGEKTYLLDPKSPMCPYLGLNSGKFCAKYKPIEKADLTR